MSILNAMYTGVSGLEAESSDLNIIGNNISNANTYGFKESRAAFDNVMGSIDPSATGDGVQLGSSQQVFTQGSLLNTGVSSDLAISGNGFFVVQGSVGGVAGNYYERDGQTSTNAQGQLVDSNGLALQGYAIGANGQMSSTLGAITLPTSALTPQPTTTVSMSANLQATSSTTSTTFDPTNPTATSNFNTSINVYDSRGVSHQASVYFTQTGANSWTYNALVPAQDTGGQAGGTPTTISSGTLTFNSNGSLNTVTPSSTSVTFTDASSQTINFSFGSQTSTGGTGLDGLTQFGTPSVISSQTQNGYASGAMSGVQVGQDGTVSGVYSNGQTIPVGQLAIATFPSTSGLTSAGNNLWAGTQKSGAAALGAAGVGGRGSISSGSLEQSNVDITAQFVDLIAQQRAFEADSKTVTTADQMMQSLMQMKQ